MKSFYLSCVILLLACFPPKSCKAQMVTDTIGLPYYLSFGPIGQLVPGVVLGQAMLYSQTDLAAEHIFPGTILYGIGWYKDDATTTIAGIAAKFTIYLRSGTQQYITFDSTYWALNYPNGPTYNLLNYCSVGLVSVGMYANGTDLNIPTPPGWVNFMFKDSFIYSGGTLEIQTRWEDSGAFFGSPHWGAFLPSSDPQQITSLFFDDPLTGLSGTNQLYSLIFFHSGMPGACNGLPDAGTVLSLPAACPGEDIQVNLNSASGGPGISYQWQSAQPGSGAFANIPGATSPNLIFTLLQPTSFRCQVSCSNSGLSSLSNVFDVNLTPPAYTDSITVTHTGNTFTFTPHVQNNNGLLLYASWDFGCCDHEGGLNITHNLLPDTIYNVLFRIANECKFDSFYLSVTVGCPGASSFNNIISASDTAFCTGDTGLLAMTTTAPPGYDLQWQSAVSSMNFTDIPGATGPSLVITPTANTSYRNKAICPNSGGVKVSNTIHTTTGPVAGSITRTHTGNTYSFAATGSQNADSYLWFFGDGDSSNAASPVHTYSTTGNFNVTLIVSRGDCKDTAVLNDVTEVAGVYAAKDNFIIAPNPATHEIKLTVAGVHGNSHDIQVVLTNMQGSTVTRLYAGPEGPLQKGRILALPDLAPGLYLVKILMDGSQVSLQKLEIRY